MYRIVVKRKNNGKILTLSFAMIILVLWILIGFNYQNPDYYYYENLFIRAEEGMKYYAVEPGFWALVNIAVYFGVSYTFFLKIYSLIGILLISSTILRYTNKPSLVLLLYLLYPFLLDVTQIRHFMAIAIFTFAIRYLEEFTYRNFVKYFMLVILAATQQIMALAFLFYLIVYITDEKMVFKLSVFFTTINFVFSKFLVSSSLIIKIFSLRNKNVNYISGINNGQFLMYACFYIILVLLCLFLKYKTNTNKDNLMLFKISVYSLLFIPFLTIDFQYSRLFRGSIILIYTYITSRIYYLNKSEQLIITILLLLFMGLVFIKLFGFNSSYYDLLTYPIFTKNYLINLFV